jgi:MFS-type transporter involved in bile tolerance (Atg22 family)
MHIIVLLAFLPSIHQWLGKRWRAGAMADLALGQGSVIFLVLGALWMAFANNSQGVIIGIVVFALGSGFAQAIRSYLTALVPRDRIGTLYSLIAVADAIGSLVAPLVFAWGLRVGLQENAKIKGMPFFLAAILYSISVKESTLLSFRGKISLNRVFILEADLRYTSG